MRNEPDVSGSPWPVAAAASYSRSRRRWWVRAVWLLGFLSPFLWILWHLFCPPERIVVSYETTRITSPLKADGRSVDYAAALRAQFQSPESVPFAKTPIAELLRRWAEERLSSDGEDPAFYDPEGFLLQGHIMSEDDRVRFRDRVYGRLPIVAASDPELAEIIEGSMPWYHAMLVEEAGGAGSDELEVM